MTTTVEYALMAGYAYRTTRDEINWFPVPQGWTPFFPVPDVSTALIFPATDGFEAVSFVKGTEIVISFAGTNPGSLLDPDNAANIGLATGYGSAQLLQAAKYYLQVKAANPPNSTITITGHSLGGGLAALIGVFFGVTATTFDQAPFAKSAELNLFTPDVATNLRNDLAALLDASGNRLYDDDALSGLSNFLQLRQANGGIPNSNLVSTIRVDGEFTSSLGVGTLFNPIGVPASVIQHGPYFEPSFDMHSQSLLTTFLQSRQTAATGQALNDVTFKLTDLLKMIFDKNLYAFDTGKNNDKKENFLERLVQHEAGVQGSITADAMVTRFNADMWKLAQDGGLTLKDGSLVNLNAHYVSNALVALAMQKYYEETNTSDGYKKELFTDLTQSGEGAGGIRFDMADVSAKFTASFAQGDRLTLSDAKGYEQYFKTYLQQSTFTVEERSATAAMLPILRDWYVRPAAANDEAIHVWRAAA